MLKDISEAFNNLPRRRKQPRYFVCKQTGLIYARNGDSIYLLDGFYFPHNMEFCNSTWNPFEINKSFRPISYRAVQYFASTGGYDPEGLKG